LKLLFLLLNTWILSHKPDTLKTPLSIRGSIQLTNNAISPVPAFSLGKPALLTTLYLQKGRLAFHPEFNFDLEAKPWSINTWVRYQIIQQKKWDFTLGNNFSLFFKKNNPALTKEEYQLQRYQAFEFNLGYHFNSMRGVNLMYWKSQSLDEVGIKNGLFIILAGQISDLWNGKNLRLSIRPSLFVIKNTAPFTGYFTSQISTLYLKKTPFNLSFQTVHPLHTEPKSKFNWNVGLNFQF
jgi:hypothetical protein